MPEHGFRRLRVIAALTFAGVTGLAGGALPSVIADDAPVITTTVAGTPCPDSPLVDGQVVTVTDGEECPPPATTDQTPPPPTDERPPPTTGETPPPPRPMKIRRRPPTSRRRPRTTRPPPSARISPPLPATGPSRPHASEPPAAQPVANRRAEESQKADKDRTRAHRRQAAEHPLHASPYAGLAMHWTDPVTRSASTTSRRSPWPTFPVPPFLLPIYQAAGAQYGIHWEILAAINEVETGFGRNLRESSAGAVGWMQFLPSTWQRYGVDADGDGTARPVEPGRRDLRRGALPARLGRRVEPSQRDLRLQPRRLVRRPGDRPRPDVRRPARRPRRGPHTRRASRTPASIKDKLGKASYLGPDAKLTMPGQALLLDDKDLRRRVLHDDQIEIYGCGRQDIVDNRIDDRVLATLEYLRLSGFDPTVSALECGHSLLTTSGNVSEHSSGDAVDIAADQRHADARQPGPGLDHGRRRAQAAAAPGADGTRTRSSR